VAKSVIRFGVGSEQRPYVPVWRLWNHRSDIYLAQRDMAGTFKISLHESGEWVSQFTQQSGVKISGKSRRHATWTRPEAFSGKWVKGPTISVPAVDWAGEIEIKQDVEDKDDVTWFPTPEAGMRLDLTVLLSEADPNPGIQSVLLPTDMLVTETLLLSNGERVWLYARQVPLDTEEQSCISVLDREFRGFSVNGRREDMRGAAGIEVSKDQPLLIQMPLGLRHFAFQG